MGSNAKERMKLHDLAHLQERVAHPSCLMGIDEAERHSYLELLEQAGS